MRFGVGPERTKTFSSLAQLTSVPRTTIRLRPGGQGTKSMWKLVKKYDWFSGMYIWTGWDYLGEPTPFPWPAVSSYFGIIDLAGFPKDPYYFYQSEWTNTPVLHVFPHWNWKQGEKVDVVAYFNNADEVELFLNGRSQGTKRKQGDDMRVFWRLAFEPGVLKAVSRKNGQVVLTREVRTAEEPAKNRFDSGSSNDQSRRLGSFIRHRESGRQERHAGAGG